MTDDDDIALSNALDAYDRAIAVHEAGHAVVAHALGAEVLFVEIDMTGGGKSKSSDFVDNAKNLAVCVAGCRAEHAFDAPTPRKTKKNDFKRMRTLLSNFPEPDRRAARGEGYRLANEALKANADVVSRIADALFARRFSDSTRIEGNELTVLLARDSTT